MKAILYVVAILVAGGAAYFSLEHSRKFNDLQKDRLSTIKTNKEVSANADVKEKELKDEKGVLAASEQKREEVTQSISALKSSGSTMEREVAELDNTLKAQADEFVDLEKTMKEVGEILKTLGLFCVTALAEIVGCYLPYLWLNQGRSIWLLLPASFSLAAFVWLLTLHPSAAGRVYAAYGGVYVSMAIAWLWAVECPRRLKFDPPCRSNIDPGRIAAV